MATYWTGTGPAGYASSDSRVLFVLCRNENIKRKGQKGRVEAAQLVRTHESDCKSKIVEH